MEIEIKKLQKTEEWFEQRLGKFTASTIVEIMKKGRAGEEFTGTFRTYLMEKIAERLTGRCKQISSPSMDWGNEMEDQALIEYQKLTGIEPVENGFIPLKGYEDWAGGSPDATIDDGEGILEVKCPYVTTNHVETLVTKDIPKKYKKKYTSQMQFNMWVTGAKYCDFISYDPRAGDKQIIVIRIDRDDKYIKEMEERLKLAIKEFEKMLSAI